MTDNSNITTTDYAEGRALIKQPVAVFSKGASWRQANENDQLQFFSHAEGYVEPNGSSFNYVCQYKDHLGSVRLSYSDTDGNGSINASTEIRREQNYYPFGLEHQGYNSYKYGVENNLKTYQSQEFTAELVSAGELINGVGVGLNASIVYVDGKPKTEIIANVAKEILFCEIAKVGDKAVKKSCRKSFC